MTINDVKTIAHAVHRTARSLHRDTRGLYLDPSATGVAGLAAGH